MTAPIQRTSVESALSGQDNRLSNLEAVPTFAQYEIKVTADDDGDADPVETASTFIFCVPRDLDESRLLDAQAFITSEGSSDLTIQLFNINTTTNMLSQEIEIQAGELTSYTAPQAVIDEEFVAVGNLIQIVVTQDGGGDAYGLGVILKFTVTFPGA